MTNEDLLIAVFRAYKDARKNKRSTSSQLQFEMDHEAKLIRLYETLRDRSYKPGPCIRFVVSDPVKREVFASEFSFRIVHHLYYNAVAPVVERLLIYDTSSCRKGKGSLFGVRRLEHHIRSVSRNYTRDCWVLKLDIEGYFMSIIRSRLRKMLRRLLIRHYREQEHGLSLDFLLWLTDLITTRNPLRGCRRIGSERDWAVVPRSKQLSFSPQGVGLVIGDLTSQLSSNVYQNGNDHYIKRVLHIRHFHHYVDDSAYVSETREELERIAAAVDMNLRSQCGVHIHPHKVHYYHVWSTRSRRGDTVPFLGGRIHAYYTYLSKRTTHNYLHYIAIPHRDPLRHWQALNSYLGQLRHYNAAALTLAA
ncbi:MAG: RNA-directed DNA polymerase [Paludibacteraceae bacterium]|nr:RNA-directed DNA polymerase [Paludibacteraceae bacterium]